MTIALSASVGECGVCGQPLPRRVVLQDVVCGAPHYLDANGTPEHPNDLKQHEIVDFNGKAADSKWYFDDDLAVQLAPPLTFSSVAPCIASAEGGWVLARVLSYEVGHALKAENLRTILSDYTNAQWPIHVVHTTGRLQSAKVRSYLDLATERLKNDPLL